MLAHAGPFNRIIVDKDQAIDTNVQLSRYRFEVRRLVVPIGDECGKVRTP